MKFIYLITQKVSGPSGHGEPSCENIALHDNRGDNPFSIGELSPAYLTKESAELALSKTDTYFHGITKLEIEE